MPDRSLLLRASLGLERCERTGRPRLTKTSLRACVFHGCALGNHGVWPGLRPNWRLENFHTTPRRPSVECRSRSAGFPLLDLQGMASRSIVAPRRASAPSKRWIPTEKPGTARKNMRGARWATTPARGDHKLFAHGPGSWAQRCDGARRGTDIAGNQGKRNLDAWGFGSLAAR